MNYVVSTCKTTIAGWNYSIQYVQDGSILLIRCQKRFDWIDPKFLGDDWLLNKLKEAVAAHMQGVR